MFVLGFTPGFVGQIILEDNRKWLGGGFNYFLFSPRTLGKIPILTSIFFKWVGSTTN